MLSLRRATSPEPSVPTVGRTLGFAVAARLAAHRGELAEALALARVPSSSPSAATS